MVRLALVLLLGRRRVLRVFLSAALGLVAGACIWVFHSVRVEAIGSNADSLAIQTPVKAHLRNGSTVLYRTGVLLARDTLRGPGVRYGLRLSDSTAVSVVALDSVVAMESFRRATNGAPTAIVSTLATGAGLVAAAVAAFVIVCSTSDCFGNCPTVYADSAGTWALQAEGFSYTLGATFETRDVDRLGIRPDRDGRIRLEVRNEALETEYVNHLELLEVRHAREETALPDPDGAALAVRDLVPATTITDAAGRDLRLLLALPDGAAFRTDAQTLAGASPAHLDDAIYLVAPAPASGDSVALVVRLRNSLLASLLYSEVMLGDRGARSLDWIGRELDRGGVTLARWQEQRMGMRIAVWDGRGYREIARLRDSGPHAWNDVAVLIPVVQPNANAVPLNHGDVERRGGPHPRGSTGQRSRSAVLSGGQLADRPGRVRHASAPPGRPNARLRAARCPGARRLLCARECATRRPAIPPDLAWRALYRRRRSGGRSGGAGADLPDRHPGLLPALDRPRWAQSCARYGRRGVP